MKLFGVKIDTDVLRLDVQPDGSIGACYFCGSPVIKSQDFALLHVERVDPEGNEIQGVCHGACAEHARHA